MVQRQERLLAATYRGSANAMGGRLEDRGPTAAARWILPPDATVGTLTALLDRLPDDFTVVSAMQARQYGYWGLAQVLASRLRGAVAVEDGLQAGEIRRAIEMYGVDADTPINPHRLLRRMELWNDRPVKSGRT
jgi:hypothetical protein